MKYILGLIILFVSFSSDSSQIDDLRLFRELLERNHPLLYGYTSEKSFDNYFEQAEKLLKQNPDDISLFTKLLASLIEKVGCGHTKIEAAPEFSKRMLEFQTFFPLAAEVVDKKLYVLDEKANKVLQVKAINGQSANKILESIYDVASSDARNPAFKNHFIGSRFFIYFNLAGLSSAEYKVKWQDQSGQEGETLYQGKSFQEVAQVSGKAQLQKYDLNNEKEYQLKHYPGLSVLSVRGFGFRGDEEKAFHSFIDQTFTTLREQKIQKLVIDLQGNGGGSRSLSVALFRYIASKEFKQREEMRVKSREPSREHLVKPKVELYPKILALLSNRFNENFIQQNDHLSENMKPHKQKFSGDVAVLVDNGTYSAAGEFALLAKEDPAILVVGQETGFNCAQHNGDLTLTYQLPFTKTLLEIPTVHIKHAQSSCDNNFSGVIPDIIIASKPFSNKAYDQSSLLSIFEKGF